MKITTFFLNVIEMPLKTPFTTHLETVTTRRGIILEVKDENGESGYGEAVAFTTPWYTEETVRTNYHIIKDVLFPLIAGKQIDHPSAVSKIFESVRGNQMAKAAVETAIWDLFSKVIDKPLAQILGGTRSEVLSGAVAAAPSVAGMVTEIENLTTCGYERIKIKINPDNDIEMLTEIRRHFPELPLLADANSAYTMADAGKLKKLDQFHLLMIEQPLGVDDIVDHAKLQKIISTPICLDESICSLHDAKSAIEIGSCGVINIKVGRVGGLQPAKDIHDYCQRHGIKVWVGGMIEFGVSRAHNVALASLSGFAIPGDISSSDKYWEEDIISPPIRVNGGRISVSRKPGIGYDINQRRLQQVTLHKEKLT